MKLMIEPAPSEQLLQRLAQLEATARSPADWGRVAEALAAAVTQHPGDVRLWANWGNALWIADRVEEALARYQRAVQLAPQEALVYRGLGNVLTDLQRFEAADRAYQRSRELMDDPLTAWNHSQLLMGLERYEEGFALSECRWMLPGVAPWRDPATAWQPQADDGERPLLVWSEQGLGDTLQHLRWLRPLQRRRGPAAAPLLLEVEPALVGLLETALPDLAPRPLLRAKADEGADGWRGAHVSLLSLPALLGGGPLPEHASWLVVPSGSRTEGRRRVGLVWAAGRKLEEPVTAREYWRRSLTPPALEALIGGIEALGMQTVLLQFGDDREWAEDWRRRGIEDLPATADFAATAERVAGLDLVITVDTAMAHLVGAMKKEGWVLLPFSAAPRWLRQRDDSPWYPSLRLFRQRQPGEWGAVVDEVLEALKGRG